MLVIKAAAGIIKQQTIGMIEDIEKKPPVTTHPENQCAAVGRHCSFASTAVDHTETHLICSPAHKLSWQLLARHKEFGVDEQRCL